MDAFEFGPRSDVIGCISQLCCWMLRWQANKSAWAMSRASGSVAKRVKLIPTWTSCAQLWESSGGMECWYDAVVEEAEQQQEEEEKQQQQEEEEEEEEEQ